MSKQMVNGPIPDDLYSILSKGEKILWVGRAHIKPFILKHFTGLIPLLVFAIIPVLIVPFNVLWSLPVLLFFTLWYGVVCLLAFSSLIYPILAWRNIWYVLTDMRVIVRKGVIGIDYDILTIDYVQQVNVDRGVWDRIYGTGTIVIQAVGVSPVKLYSVVNPFKVQDIIAEAIRARRSYLK